MNYQINCTQDGVIQYPMHRHKSYEIMIYLDGQGYMRTEAEHIAFRRGTIIIVPPEIEHGSVSEQGFKNISIEGEFEGYLNFDRVMVLADNETWEGTTLAKLIYENRYGNRGYLASLCKSYVCFLLQRFELENTIQQSIQKTIMEISEHAFDPEINLAKLLQKSGYSEDYIRSVFKKLTGKTPTEFLTDVRIHHACFLIEIYKHDLSLPEIAERCGYLDYIYFSKKFKKVVGGHRGCIGIGEGGRQYETFGEVCFHDNNIYFICLIN